MEDIELKNILKNGALELGVTLSEVDLGQFITYLKELQAWNRKINLTSIESDKEIVIRHFLDSLTTLPFVKDSKRLLDIGSGAGFPGIPLKIAAPLLEVTLLDSVEKKVHFMRHIIRTLGLKGIEATYGRAEDPKIIERYGSLFDCVISRAFAELGKFLELSLPFVAKGGSIIAIKGPAFDRELEEARYVSGVEGPEIHEIKVPFEDRKNVLVIFRKA
ncbi:MAG: 16S rRNA (guanine(527)-N(7))-methyltransferase RsmG [Deltaproteobacteria bacterium]|nr:16S rRNA (guanine(527)-N(7))-methyltransferase RsmG [Deltaproteobacteria bacterium]